MSFEGYYQILCRNGHIGGADCYDEPNFDGPESFECEDLGEVIDCPLWRCSECNELAGWWNLVNTTNGSFYEGQRIDGYIELELVSEPEPCTCKCGYVHPKSGEVAKYQVPENKGGHFVNGGLL